jgi:hypothetical protein
MWRLFSLQHPQTSYSRKKSSKILALSIEGYINEEECKHEEENGKGKKAWCCLESRSSARGGKSHFFLLIEISSAHQLVMTALNQCMGGKATLTLLYEVCASPYGLRVCAL